MALAGYKIRITANACIIRWEDGERTMNDIVASYNHPQEDSDLIKAEIIKKRPDIDFESTEVPAI
jgi:hypothetical protein